MQPLKSQESFSWWRNTFFPIHNKEIPKVLFFFIIYFCLILISILSRMLKDFIFIIYLQKNPFNFYLLSSEKNIFIKLVIFTLLLLEITIPITLAILNIKISRKYSPFKVFRMLLIPSVSFLTFSTFFCKYIKVPSLLFGFLIKFCADVIVLLVSNVIFWQLVNFYCSYNEKKRFFPLCCLVGIGGAFFSSFLRPGPFNSLTPIFFIGLLLFFTRILLMALRAVEKSPYIKPLEEIVDENLDKSGIISNFRAHPSLIFICLTAICYSITVSSMGYFWEFYVLEFCGRRDNFMTFMSTYKNLVTRVSFIGIFLGSSIVRRWSWGSMAMRGPIIVLCTSSLFFLINSSFFKSFLIITFHGHHLWWVVMVGGGALFFLQILQYLFVHFPKQLFVGSQTKNSMIQVHSLELLIASYPGLWISRFIKFYIKKNAHLNIAPIFLLLNIFICVLWMYMIRKINKEMVLVE